MAASEGSTSVIVAVIDGPVDRAHPALAAAQIEVLGEVACDPVQGAGCRHGTFIAGLLVAARSTQAAGICPGCRLLARPVFAAGEADAAAPSAAPEELAAAILQVIAGGARIINLSLALLDPGISSSRVVQMALDAAMQHGVLVAAASGNQGLVGSTLITRHPWVIPVAACNTSGWPLGPSNLSASVGRNGLLAPGEVILGAAPGGGYDTASGTSVAVSFVVGTLALLASLCPWANAAELRRAIGGGIRRHSVVPPLLDAATAWQVLTQGRRS
jgi:subtilisin family serine protease